MAARARSLLFWPLVAPFSAFVAYAVSALVWLTVFGVLSLVHANPFGQLEDLIIVVVPTAILLWVAMMVRVVRARAARGVTGVRPDSGAG